MVVKEFYRTREDGVVLFRTYSDAGLYIKQVETGAEYSEAIDIDGSPFTYEETDRHVESEQGDTPNVK
jgi:hypothetical protein